MPERRESTKHYIIHPCVISLQGSTPEEEGLHISLQLSEVIINISPATIELINKAMNTLKGQTSESQIAMEEEKNYSTLWNPAIFKDNEFWYIKDDGKCY